MLLPFINKTLYNNLPFEKGMSPFFSLFFKIYHKWLIINHEKLACVNILN